MPEAATESPPDTLLRTERGADGTPTLILTGSLNSQSTGLIWRQALQALGQAGGGHVVLDASQVSYCDGSGIGLLFALRRQQQAVGGETEIRGLAPEFQQLLDLYDPAQFGRPGEAPTPRIGAIEEIGRKTVGVFTDMGALITFSGELVVALLAALRHPGRVRWRDALMVAEATGVNALPIISLLGFMIGLILAFQSAIPMRQFGADVFVANLVGAAHIRELGPLITAIIIAGRSGSAFAAELGTMKVREEIDALTTMGLDPVRFLVVTRVIAAVCMIPILTTFADLFGLIGGAVVYSNLGFSLAAYMTQLRSSVSYGDLLGGLFKSLAFGVLVAGIGCLRGLQTKTGASAVGDSATRSVVSGIILIILTDAVFAVVFFYLGI
jgi:phospholipid/cholesterol/gamma-HCH transport system permease protein